MKQPVNEKNTKPGVSEIKCNLKIEMTLSVLIANKVITS